MSNFCFLCAKDGVVKIFSACDSKVITKSKRITRIAIADTFLVACHKLSHLQVHVGVQFHYISVLVAHTCTQTVGAQAFATNADTFLVACHKAFPLTSISVLVAHTCTQTVGAQAFATNADTFLVACHKLSHLQVHVGHVHYISVLMAHTCTQTVGAQAFATNRSTNTLSRKTT